MRRRVHIEFMGKSSVVITNYLRQKKFDLSKLKSKYLDLVTFQIYTNDTWTDDDLSATVNHAYDNETKKIIYSYLEIYARQGRVAYISLGTAQQGQFHYSHQSNPKTINTNEGTYEATIV